MTTKTTEFLNQWDVANVFSSCDRGLIQEFLERFSEAVKQDTLSNVPAKNWPQVMHD